MKSPDNGERRSSLGLALAGGGPEGAIYEIGALRALDEALDGIDFTALDTYVGVSAGSFVAACLANGLSTGHLARAMVDPNPGEPLVADVFFRPDLLEFARRGLRVPQLAWHALADWFANPRDQSLVGSFARLTRALPIGMFTNDPMRAELCRLLDRPGRTDNFRELDGRLIVVAADLDSGAAVRFGTTGLDHVPISTAVQASTALPGLYPPVLIDGRYYVDGVLLKTLHASVALESGVDLLLCLNPIVPVDTADAVRAGIMRRGHLVDRGLPGVLSQTFRTLVHSRLTVGMASYEPRYPDRDVVLIEPARDDYRMFFTNIFSFTNRRTICEHAYASTLRQLRERRDTLRPMLARHGIRLRDDVLDEPGRSLVAHLPLRAARGGPQSIASRLDSVLDRLDSLLSS